MAERGNLRRPCVSVRLTAQAPWAGLAGAALWLAGAAAHAGVLRYCDPPAELSAAQQDTLFRFATLIKDELERSGEPLALIARSGLDLSRFGVRYTHAGVSLRESPNAPWSVRQLYYDCDERKPRLFDQGIAGFLFGTVDPAIGYVSVVQLPGDASRTLERVVQDNRQAIRLLGTTYSANAYAFAPRYQNCNQWVAEMLALAWAPLDAGAEGEALRAQAQDWLRAEGYEATRFEVGNPLLMWLGGTLPWLHRDDHPPEDQAQMRFVVSMPDSIEAFVRTRVPGARRIEFCHADRRVVIRHGWDPIADGCRPAEGDTVIALD